MDDAYAIRLAKTKLRDAYAKGDVKGVLSVYGDGFSDMSADLPSFYGVEARAVLKHRLTKLFARYDAKLTVTIISIAIQGTMAFDWGWHKLTLISKTGGRARNTRTRYLEIWTKGADEKWKIAIFFDNVDLSPQMPPKEVLAELKHLRNDLHGVTFSSHVCPMSEHPGFDGNCYPPNRIRISSPGTSSLRRCRSLLRVGEAT